MPVLWAILWGISIPLIMWATIKYWLPRLTEQPAQSAMSDEADNEKPVPGPFAPRTWFFREKGRIALLLLAGVFSAVCGYTAAANAGTPLSFLRIWMVFSVLACITVTDLETFLIPNECSLAVVSGSLVLLVIQWVMERTFPVSTLVTGAVSAVICMVLLLIMSAVARGGLGMGDVKILSSIAFLCGIRMVCYLLTIALLLSAVGSAILLLIKKKQLKDLLPLGPFLWAAMGLLVLLRIFV